MTGDDRVSVRCRRSAPFLSNNRDRPAKVVVYRLHDPRRGQEITTTRHLGIYAL